MSYRDHLVNFFRSQAQVATLRSDELLKFPAVTLENFFHFELRRYPGYEGLTPDGESKSVPARLLLGIKGTKELAAVLNGDGELGPITVSGIELPKEAEAQLIKDAEKCRAELLDRQESEFPNIADLRIAQNSMNRKVLTTSLMTGIDEDHLDPSPLLMKLIDDIRRE